MILVWPHLSDWTVKYWGIERKVILSLFIIIFSLGGHLGLMMNSSGFYSFSTWLWFFPNLLNSILIKMTTFADCCHVMLTKDKKPICRTQCINPPGKMCVHLSLDLWFLHIFLFYFYICKIIFHILQCFTHLISLFLSREIKAPLYFYRIKLRKNQECVYF